MNKKDRQHYEEWLVRFNAGEVTYYSGSRFDMTLCQSVNWVRSTVKLLPKEDLDERQRKLFKQKAAEIMDTLQRELEKME